MGTAATVMDPWVGYERASGYAQPRMIWMASGEVGTGKTRFGLLGPSPILVISNDKGTEGVVEPILREDPAKHVYVKEYAWNPQGDNFTQEYAAQVRDQIIADYRYGLKHARTVIIDTETQMWQVFRYAEFGGPSDAPKNYAPLNQRYFALIEEAKSTPGVNVGFLQSMTTKWSHEMVVDPRTGARKKVPVPTDQRERSGFDRLDEAVQVEMHFTRTKGEFMFQLGKCRLNSAYSDMEVPACTFAQFGSLMLPESTEADWV